MSENLKLRIDLPIGEDKLTRSAASSGDVGAIDQTESQMRKALGLLGDTPRHRPEPERAEAPSRTLGLSGGLHRRRFVQDGDVPVTVLRREQGHDAPQHRSAPSSLPPATNRLQRVEAQLAAETAAREKTERQLQEVQGIVRDLQTKIGHAELAKVEAVEALRQEREATAQQRAEFAIMEERDHDLAAQLETAQRELEEVTEQLHQEREGRRQLEKALHAAETARHAAEQLAQSLPEDKPAPTRSAPQRSRAVAKARRRATETAEVEAEPVKWWLNPAPVTKRR